MACPRGWFGIRIRENGHGDSAAPALGDLPAGNLGRINNVEMTLTVEIGRTRMSVRDVLGMEPGAVVELDRCAGAPADVLLNGRLIAHGEVVVVDQDYAVRITQHPRRRRDASEPAVDTLVITLRVALSLGVVLALMWVLHRAWRRGSFGRAKTRGRRCGDRRGRRPAGHRRQGERRRGRRRGGAPRPRRDRARRQPAHQRAGARAGTHHRDRTGRSCPCVPPRRPTRSVGNSAQQSDATTGLRQARTP